MYDINIWIQMQMCTCWHLNFLFFDSLKCIFVDTLKCIFVDTLKCVFVDTSKFISGEETTTQAGRICNKSRGLSNQKISVLDIKEIWNSNVLEFFLLFCIFTTTDVMTMMIMNDDEPGARRPGPAGLRQVPDHSQQRGSCCRILPTCWFVRYLSIYDY